MKSDTCDIQMLVPEARYHSTHKLLGAGTIKWKPFKMLIIVKNENTMIKKVNGAICSTVARGIWQF